MLFFNVPGIDLALSSLGFSFKAGSSYDSLLLIQLI